MPACNANLTSLSREGDDPTSGASTFIFELSGVKTGLLFSGRLG